MAKREHYIIDGYNVIHSWPELDEAARHELAEARDKLINIMAEYGAYQKYDVTIVFDALFTSDEMHDEKHGEHLDVVYTSEGETADSFIERLAYELAKKGLEVHVVTSDGAEQSVVLGAGAYRLPSRELLREVRRVKKQIKNEYLVAPKNFVTRVSVSDRIDSDTAARLDAMRKHEI